MDNQNYKKLRQECWEEFQVASRTTLKTTKQAFEYIFDHAYALGKQEKDAEKKPSLTDKEVYALESAISELESLMDGTLDEDYHKEQKIVINALKRIIKKYEKK